MAGGKSGLITQLAAILMAVGAINWGLMGILEKDLIMGILGLGWSIARIIYVIVGVAGIWSLFTVLPKVGK